MALRVALVGYGKIGEHIVRAAASDPRVEVVGILEVAPARQQDVPTELLATDLPALLRRRADLYAEVAQPEAIRQMGQALAAAGHLLPFSLTAFADDDVRAAITAAAQRSGHQVFIPHGALVGIDGIRAARNILTEVTVTTTKPPYALGRKDTIRTVVFAGPSREGCAAYPRNVNVHAAVALAGIGFDRQRSIIVSDPDLSVNRQEVVAKAPGVDIYIRIEAESGPGVTGAYAPEAAWMSVQRIAGGDRVSFV